MEEKHPIQCIGVIMDGNRRWARSRGKPVRRSPARPAGSAQGFTGKKRLVFAPAKYLDQEHLKRYNIDFAQLPFEIYQKAK